MAYLITHIAISLVFADLLGLLLGWLIWGYAARQRSQEAEDLRERLSDMQMALARQMAAGNPEARMALPEASAPVNSAFIENELPERTAVRRAFFEDEEDELAQARTVPAKLPIAPDLEAEVRESRFQHLQQQVRDLEGFRDRIPLLQADLSDALAGRREAEAKFQEAKQDFEVRSSSLLSQIRDFETAAAEWEQIRDGIEREKLAHEKELESVKATLRDLQNSQRPQTVEASTVAPNASAIELADLRERYQRSLRERDALAAELEFWKQSDGASKPNEAARIAELEEGIRSRDTQLAAQAARVESLLWRVAELEPFASEAPNKDETMRRQESEIAGHLAMHSENAERIRSLQNHVAELQATTIPTEELQRIVGEHQSEVERLTQQHQQHAAELRQSMEMKDDEIAEHVSARYGQTNLLNTLQARVTELEASIDTAQAKIKNLEKLISDRDTEIRGLLSAHSEMQREKETWKSQAQELEPIAARVPSLQSSLDEMTAELASLRESHNDKEGQLTFLQERLGVLSSRLAAHQNKLLQLEPVAARAPELEQQLMETQQQSQDHLKALEARHHEDVTRLKVTSAQRLRRLRQGITSFRS